MRRWISDRLFSIAHAFAPILPADETIDLVDLAYEARDIETADIAAGLLSHCAIPIYLGHPIPGTPEATICDRETIDIVTDADIEPLEDTRQ